MPTMLDRNHTSRSAIMVILAVAVLWTPTTADATTGPLPWKSGDEVANGFTLRKVQRATEYVRLELRRGGDAFVLEIRQSQGQAGDYDTGTYRVQPGPGYDAPDGGPLETLARKVTTILQDWQQRPGHKPFVTAVAHRPGDGSGPPKPHVVAKSSASSWSAPKDHGWGAYLPWLLLDLALIGLLLWVAPIAGFWSVLAGIASFLLLPQVPLQWLNSLQEGTTGQRIEQLYGHGIHAGSNFVSLSHALTGGQGYGIADLARIHIAVWASSAVLFTAFALRRIGVRFGLLLGATWALNGMSLNAASSELPSAWIGWWLFVGAVLAQESVQAAGRRKWLLVGGLAAVVVALAGVRMEWLVVGACGAAVLGWAWLSEAVPFFRRLKTSWSVLSPMQRAVGGAVAVLLIGGVMLPLVSGSLQQHCQGHWCYFVRSLSGEDLFRSLIWLPGFLLGTALPLGFGVVLAVVMARTTAFPMSVGGVGISLLLLYRVYFIAGHGITLEHYELYRYTSMLLPLAFVLAVYSVSWIAESAFFRALSGERQRAIGVALAVTFGIFPAMGSTYDPPWRHAFDRNQQREVRTLLRWTRQHPHCAFASVVTRPGRNGDKSVAELALFGGPQAPINPARYPPDAWDELWKDASSARCVMLYDGIDCGLLNGLCERFHKGPVVEHRTFASARFIANHFPRPAPDANIALQLRDISRSNNQRPQVR